MKKMLGAALFLCLVLAGLAGNAPAGEAITLRFIDVSPGPVRQKYFDDTFKKFFDETGIQVQYESVPWDDAANKLTMLGATEQLPDVLTTWAGWLGQFVPAGWVIPLDKYLVGKEGEYTSYVNNVIWAGERENYKHVYTVPDGMMVKGIYYRKDWCAENNIKFDDNWTYDDFFSMVKGLADPAKKRYGNSYRGARGAFDPLLVYLQSFTGGRTFDSFGNCLINSPECVEAFKKWTNMYLGGYVPKDSINWGFIEMVDNFTGGLTGTLINDSEVAPTCLATMKDSEWGVMPMPLSTVDGKRLNTVNSPYAYTISGHSQNPDAAFKLIEFLSRPDNNIEFCKLTGLIPVRKMSDQDALYSMDGHYGAFLKQVDDPKLVIPPTYGPFNFTDMHQGMLHEEVQSYLLGKQSAEDVLAKIANELTFRMKEYLAENPGAVVETPKTLR